MSETIYSIIYVVVILGLTVWLNRKYKSLQNVYGAFYVFAGGVICSVLHNLIYAIWEVEEPVFFLLGILGLGLGPLLVVVICVRYLFKKR